MNEQLELIGTEKMMTTRELAIQLGTQPNVITENAKKCLPNKKIENGKPTYWTKAEITVLLECLKSNNQNQFDLSRSLIGISTELTPALKIKKAFDLMQEGYEEELARLRAENEEKEKVIKRIADGKGCFTMSQTAKALKLPYGRNTLFNKLKDMKLLFKNNEPYQEYVNSNYFKVITKVCEDKENHSVTLVTGKGLVYLAKKFNTEIDESVQADA